MQLQTKRFGMLTITEGELYTFSNGIPGFEDYTTFIIVAPEEDAPFAYLQSIQNGELTFIITDPFLFYPDYDFEIPESALTELSIQSINQVQIKSIVSIQEEINAASINLVAPLVFNEANRSGKQVVLSKTAYLTRHPLFKAIVKE